LHATANPVTRDRLAVVGARSNSRIDHTFWVLIGFYAVARFLQVFPGRLPMSVVVALHVFPPAIFAVLHGAKSYGWRGISTFVAITLVVGLLFENVGVRTGFPFGRYYFTDVMGPKTSAVPVMLAFAYIGMAYLSWTIAMLILGDKQKPAVGRHVVILPLVAAFIMVAWDFSMDPVWATILHAWVWLQGGAYFGVPVSNFLGWFLLVCVIFQSFALYLRGRPANREPLPFGYWREPLLFYAVSAAGNLLLAIPRPGATIVSDPSGALWRVRDITGTCALVTIFTMGVFAFLAWVRLADEKSEDTL
jgi:uncharacterized membrane protein